MLSFLGALSLKGTFRHFVDSSSALLAKVRVRFYSFNSEVNSLFTRKQFKINLLRHCWWWSKEVGSWQGAPFQWGAPFTRGRRYRKRSIYRVQNPVIFTPQKRGVFYTTLYRSATGYS
jgi:hypothetical protein